MTNGDRIRGMDNKELAKELRRFADCDFRGHVNLEGWLNSEEEDYLIPGERAVVRMNDGKTYCGVIVSEKSMMGQNYYNLVMDDDFPYGSRILSAPKKSVKKSEVKKGA